MVAFWCGSFVNSYVLAKMKLLTGGRWLWTRTIGSTLCGELVDSALAGPPPARAPRPLALALGAKKAGAQCAALPPFCCRSTEVVTCRSAG
jgi:hypothetical protein